MTEPQPTQGLPQSGFRVEYAVPATENPGGPFGFSDAAKEIAEICKTIREVTLPKIDAVADEAALLIKKINGYADEIHGMFKAKAGG